MYIGLLRALSTFNYYRLSDGCISETADVEAKPVSDMSYRGLIHPAKCR